MIPKVIHYCWFGGNPKSKVISKCMESWKKYLPDFEIKEWNETNFDINMNQYVKEAYQQKKWAFVSDYARFYVLYNEGGIYFDTDVEVIKSFPKEILNKPAFTGVEDESLYVSPGLVFGCEKGNQFVKELLDSFENDIFDNQPIEKMLTINNRITKMLKKDGFKVNNQFQEIDGIAIYPCDYFCAFDPKRRENYQTENTIAMHRYTGSWMPWYRKLHYNLGTIQRRLKYKKKIVK